MLRATVLTLLAAAAASAASLSPYGLECEARPNPLGVDSPRPRLSWKLKSTRNGDTQTAYQVLVATSADKLAPGAADGWDSRRVASAETSSIEYGGAALRSLGRYWWKVRVWDASGQPSEWSEAAAWTSALLPPDNWRAAWITHPDHALRSGPLPIFRKEVAIDRPVRRALVLVSGLGFHELHINGTRVGDHVLAPAWSNYRATVYYETHDVTSLVKQGANAIGVMLGNGFYNVAGGRYTKYTGSFGQPRLSLQLRLEMEDGGARDVVTDGTWRVTHGPIAFSCIFGGEDYDARLEADGWDRPGFDDSRWLRPTPVEAPGGAMRAQSSPPIRVQRKYKPVRVTDPAPGIRVYDLGQNFAGWPTLTVTGAAGASVKIIPGELLDEKGLVSQRSSGGPVSFSYTTKGSGRETWSPRFTYYGFRYLQVEGSARVEEIGGEFVHLDAPRAGEFSCSKDLFNRIRALIDAAVRSNLQHVLTDCPHREKLGWLEVAHLMGESLVYNWDLRTVLPKFVRDMRDAQTVDGLVPDIAPEYVVFRGGFRDSPEWGSSAILLPRLAAEWYGDKRTLADAYRMMGAYSAYLGGQARDRILSFGLGDWYDIGPQPPGRSQLTPLGLTATAIWLDDLRALRNAARMLGREADAQRWAAEFAAVHTAFQKTFYKRAASTYATGSQTSLAMPLALGLAPAGARAGLVEKLVADIRARGNHTSAGDVGYRYVVGALTAAGRSDVLFDLASQTSAPSYAAQLAAGATSLTEAWDASPRSSQNHLMLGHIEQWFWAGLAGIRPEPGMQRVAIRPEPVGDVDWVKARWESFRGPVVVEWRIEGGRFRMTAEIPPGMSATVRLPDGETRAVTSGRHELEAKNFRWAAAR
jgi:alpha-L-rhamnosidase